MAYSPLTDFLALLRQTSGGARVEQMPGLDYVMAALSRAGMFSISVGQVPPTTNQTTTIWIKPALPSWSAEASIFLWDPVALVYSPASNTLWQSLFSPPVVGSNVFQSVSGVSANIGITTSLLAIQRVNPAATALNLPSVIGHGKNPLRIVDWSTAVTAHAITITPFGTETIMQLPNWVLNSSPAQLSGVDLFPSVDLNGWVIAP